MHFVPEPEMKKAKGFVMSLVSPEELKKPELRIKPIPPPKLVPQPKVFPHPKQSPPSIKRVTPGRSLLHLEKPVVPGEGKETGKPLPEGMLPKEGGEGKSKGRKEADGTKDTKNAVGPGSGGFTVRGSLKEITEAMVKRNFGGSGSKAKKEDAITFDTEDYRYAGYMRNLRQKIESIWVYPSEAVARGIYGDLRIRFTINKDGRLGGVELVRTSGHRMLDEAAIKALKDGEPYWPLPDSWGRDSYTILGHFIYVYGGGYSIR